MKMKPLILALASAAIAGVTHPGFAATPASDKTAGYWYNSSGQPIRSAQGECLHTSNWNAALATPACDPQLTQQAAAPAAVVPDSERAAEPSTGTLTAEESAKLDRPYAVRPEDNEHRLGSFTALPPGEDGANPNHMDARRADTDGRNENEQVGTADAENDGLMGPSNIVTNTHFAFNRAEISYEEEKRLDNMIGNLSKLPDDSLIQVTGHADAIGDPEYNINLSMRRAKAMREYLINNGIEPKRIVIAALGASEPVASNDTPEGRALNRRAELQITRVAQLEQTGRTHMSAL